jgi:hypothetical protein
VEEDVFHAGERREASVADGTPAVSGRTKVTHARQHMPSANALLPQRERNAIHTVRSPATKEEMSYYYYYYY